MQRKRRYHSAGSDFPVIECHGVSPLMEDDK